MIQPQELRIGNWIYDYDDEEHYQIEQICTHRYDSDLIGVVYRQRSAWSSLEGIESIPLNEEWLIRFGFEQDKETGSWSILTSLEKFDYLFEVQNKHQQYFNPDFLSIDIQYVHQLQNLYYSLTGTELVLQETVKP